MARPRFSVVDRAGQPDYKPPLPGPRWAGSAQVAQLVEHATENRSVGGSIPPLGTIKIKCLANIPDFDKSACPHYVRIKVVDQQTRRRASRRVGAGVVIAWRYAA